MKLPPLLACLIVLSLGGCSLLPSAGPIAADVVGQGQEEGGEILFDLVDVDSRVVSALLAQPKESFQARFKKDGGPAEIRIAVGDTVSVSIWESAAGGLFTEAPPAPSVAGSRSATEPLEEPTPPTGRQGQTPPSGRQPSGISPPTEAFPG